MDVDNDASDDVELGVSEPEEGPVPVESTALLPEKFIYVRHHRNAEKPLPEIIPLESSPEAQVPSYHGTPRHPGNRPFAPFRTFADYKFASRCIKRRMPKHDIDEDLRDMHGGVYSTDSFVTFRNHRDLNRSLVAARLTNVAVSMIQALCEYYLRGKRYNIDVEFRDPWKLMKRWICNESLAAVSTWYSQQKFLCLNGEIDFSNPLYDEPWTGTMWREIDDQLPEKPKYPPCFVGLHIWLDKGLVSTKVKMHPILLREIDPKTLSGSLRSEYDQLKRQIYHAVCRLILSSLQKRSLGGETLKFGDGGSSHCSMDFEEIAAWLAIRNSRALHPCPQCLVHKDDLHRLSQVYPARTAVSMKRVLTDAPRGPKTAREEYLREYGLHDFVHFLWEFAHSELYKAVGFDKLHFFDGGEFGRHAWVLLKEYLQNHQLASTFNQWMDQFPRWRNLKHIFGATNISYSEGQTFVDILKCVLPCIVQLVPTNSWLVQWMRALQKIQAMLALEVTTKSRLQYLRELQIEYEACCEKISEKHGKSFNYLKHHFLSHAIENFMGKGTSFQQEVSEMYQITNAKNAEHQIALIDENEEAMARLDMQVAIRPDSTSSAPVIRSLVAGVPRKGVFSPISLESKQGNNPLFRNFNMNLRQYLARHHPAYPLRMEQDFEIMPCKALYVNFQSSVNWKSERDILRCNPSFHNEPRYDSVIFNAEDDPLAMAELALVFRCFLPDGVKLDLAMVRPFRRSSWHPKTRTDCPIRERKSGVMFIALEHVVRGVLLCPIFGASREAFYVIDTIDGDMFLRINGIE
ncbi:hypothetical protein R3P38DRAFT_3336150 [Favolaschia claudopus]|uniref:Uncharacterized protein n=1 Tax=Favolaschia claudopus TaxID=2862362 RepID=A0AAV9Z5Y4_9AGAR